MLRRKRMGRSWKSQKVFVVLGDKVSETRHGAFLAGFDRLKSFQERPALRRKRMGRSWKKCLAALDDSSMTFALVICTPASAKQKSEPRRQLP